MRSVFYYCNDCLVYHNGDYACLKHNVKAVYEYRDAPVHDGHVRDD